MPATARHDTAVRAPAELPGRLVSVGTHELHIHCVGKGRPAVVFDAALGASSVSWTLVHGHVARATMACTYDRAGFGWSEAGPFPRTAGRIADELRTLLAAASVPPPYVLVGHSFGGLVVQIFAGRYRADTAGLVLVDPSHPDEWMSPPAAEQVRIDRGVRLCRHGAAAARLGLARIVAALVDRGALNVARALVSAISRGGLGRQDETILAPVWKLPPAQRRPLRQFWTQPRFYEALGSQIETICESAAEAAQARAGGFGDLPLVTLSAGNATPARLQHQHALARLSAAGRHVIVPDSGHWIPLDAPAAVIDAVLDVVAQARARVAAGSARRL